MPRRPGAARCCAAPPRGPPRRAAPWPRARRFSRRESGPCAEQRGRRGRQRAEPSGAAAGTHAIRSVYCATVGCAPWCSTRKTATAPSASCASSSARRSAVLTASDSDKPAGTSARCAALRGTARPGTTHRATRRPGTRVPRPALGRACTAQPPGACSCRSRLPCARRAAARQQVGLAAAPVLPRRRFPPPRRAPARRTWGPRPAQQPRRHESQRKRRRCPRLAAPPGARPGARAQAAPGAPRTAGAAPRAGRTVPERRAS